MLAVGGVAQLGEHLLCKQGVIGSNPFTSTIAFWVYPGAGVEGLVWVAGRAWSGCRHGEGYVFGKLPETPHARVFGGGSVGCSVRRAPLFFIMVNQVLVRLWARLRSQH